LTALNDALRSVMSDGAGLGSISMQISILAVWGVVSFVIAVRIFRWQ
jgi:ABC-type multidrug transport system permease subunit